MRRSTSFSAIACISSSLFGIFAPNSAVAGNMAPWAQTIIKMIDTPMIETLELYRSNGFVLVDVGKNYAAFSTIAQRLSESQRATIGTAESDSDFVISFTSCNSPESILGSKIDSVAISAKISDTSELAEELRELVVFSQTSLPTIKPSDFGASTIKEDQVFMGWNDGQKIVVEIQINKNPHQLVWRANRSCT